MLCHENESLLAKLGPVLLAERQIGIACVSVKDGVIELVEVVDSVLSRGDLLPVSTEITTWVIAGHLSCCVEWLVNIAHVVDQQTKSEGPLLLWLFYFTGKLLDEIVVRGTLLDEAGKAVHGSHYVHFWLHKGEVICVLTRL